MHLKAFYLYLDGEKKSSATFAYQIKASKEKAPLVEKLYLPHGINKLFKYGFEARKSCNTWVCICIHFLCTDLIRTRPICWPAYYT